MIKVENIHVGGFEAAIRGMRNPKKSWHLSDSKFGPDFVEIGPNDLELLKNLFHGGDEHRKYARFIHVSMDIIAPLYWWKEFDTYKVGTACNSTSTMHTIHKKEFTIDDFSHEHLITRKEAEENDLFAAVNVNGDTCLYSSEGLLEMTCQVLNKYRELYLETKDKKYWWQMIQLLPSSYNQLRTVDFNYENVFRIIHQRTGHKLDEWYSDANLDNLVDVLKSLPYVREIGGF